ncbi:MAG: DUF1801 domain-containing protein [Phycisphaerales bacterium]|nr:DUF1801 domain-containing protein [Phycisphaerales bacterium]
MTVTVRDWIAEQDAPLRPLLRKARALVRRHAPGATETVYPGWNALGFRTDHLCCVVYPFRGGVKIAFERGDEFHDPARLLQKTGKRMMFVMVHAASDLSPEVGLLIRQAASLER